MNLDLCEQRHREKPLSANRGLYVMNDRRVITSERESLPSYLRSIWKYRSLVVTFARRDLKIKYAQTTLGALWIVLQPLPFILIFSFLFGRLMKVETGHMPYFLFALMGVIGWNYFTGLSNNIGNSLIESQHILKKIYFPKIILPLSKILVGGFDFLVSFILLLPVMLIFSIVPGREIVYLPLFIVLNVATGMAVGVAVSALTFNRRDLQHFAPTIINFCIWLTPVFYPVTILPPQFGYLMYFNPIAYVIEGYRFALGGNSAPSPYYLISIIPVLILFVISLVYFRRVEDEIADYI
jgi:lipopolysaccharide transport system permease protein